MRTLLYTAVSLLLVAAITGLAMLWVHLSHRRVLDGPLVARLWGTHGVHVTDLAVLAVELTLVALLTIVMVAGFRR